MAKSEMPFLSVIVPIFNVESYIDECISSILSQTMADFELILIDDCSTDRSYEKCSIFADADRRIRLYKNDSNIGQGLTRNKGIALARGSFITFVDSDDYIDDRMYEILVRLLTVSSADIARCSFALVRGSGSHSFSQDESVKNYRVYEGASLAQYCRRYYGLLPDERHEDSSSSSPCTALYRKQLILDKSILFPSERLVRSEDLFFNIAVAEVAERIVETKAELYKYRMRPRSTSHTFSSPLGKCELLRKIAPLDPECQLRLIRSDLTAIKEASMQLAEVSYSFDEGIREIIKLERQLRIRDKLSDYPISQLPFREKIFARMALMGLGWPELLLAKADRKRRHI